MGGSAGSILTAAAFWALAAPPAPPTFEKDVRPILKVHCFHCHGEEEQPKGKLDLRLVRLMAAGGKSGPAVVPGKPGDSELWSRVEADEMPEGPKKLSAKEKDTIRRWIEAGAKTARPEPADPALARFTDEELSHWAFQPVRKPPVPAAGPPARTSVDAFLLAKLREKGLTFAAEADRRTLIRRLSFDLLGLPPTPEEVERYAADPAADAYERLVDRLLASPHYGERWGRHWLDVAGYAETEGNPGRDQNRPHAWRYRDYVIKSFNDDKPYDRFVVEQLAGDELVRKPIDPADAEAVERLTATGFLRMAPDPTEQSAATAEKNQAVADTIKVVSSAVLGLTVGCCQCHDHRYDPIPQEDYFRLRAVFDPAFDLKRWKKPSERVVDITAKAAEAEADRIEAEAKAAEAVIEKDKLELARNLFPGVLNRVPEADREAVRVTLDVPQKDRTPAQAELLKKYPFAATPKTIAARLSVYDPPADKKFEKRKLDVAKVRAGKPPRQGVMAVTEPGGPVPASFVHFRGDPDQPKAAVTPGELTVLARPGSAPDLAGAPGGPSSGRRLAYARWLTGGSHPLTARVIVNRVWMHHFGKGIVATPADFGINGERPSHPELLDWLAADFVENGWRLKRLHRLLVTSSAYRQGSRRTPEQDAIDPDNRLLARMSIRRLDAESVRDALLEASGDLNPSLFGKSVPVAEDAEGRVVVGKAGRMRGGAYTATAESAGDQANRRSVYVESKRALPLGMLEAFDLPVMTPNCDARRCSTVATQSLMFLNDQVVVGRAERLAERLTAEATDDASRVRRAFALLYGAAPTDAELADCVAFLGEQAGHFRAAAGGPAKDAPKSPAPEAQALAALCQTLMCANRFLYVD